MKINLPRQNLTRHYLIFLGLLTLVGLVVCYPSNMLWLGLLVGWLAVLGLLILRPMVRQFRHERYLAAEHIRFQAHLLNTVDQAVIALDLQGRVLYCNPSARQLYGWGEADVVGRRISELLPPQNLNRTGNEVKEHLLRGQSWVGEMNYIRPDGQTFPIYTTNTPIYDEEGALVGAVSLTIDLTARKQAEQALREAEAKYRSIFEHAVEGIFQTTPDASFLSVNPAMAGMCGYDSPEDMLETVNILRLPFYADPDQRDEFMCLIEKDDEVRDFEIEAVCKDGRIIWISTHARAVRDKTDRLLYYEGTAQDITARKKAEAQLRYNALHDALTGLSNRTLFINRLEHVVELARRRGSTYQFAVLFLDFDRFKVVNDSLGHQIGDQLLIALAARLKNCLRPGDTIARLGGDEFAILVEDITDAAGAVRIANRIQDSLAQPFNLSGIEIFMTVSIGIAFSESGYELPADLMRNADTALYQAKAQGRARYAVWDSGMHTSAVKLLQLENDLRRAVERHEFEVYYQPIVTLDTGRLTGFEALVRWQHPERGVIAPVEFIPYAEETGLIVPIGWWMLRESCRQLCEWQTRFPSDSPLTISVNLSCRQFLQADLPAQVAQCLKETGLNPACLKLEITESVIMENAEDVTSTLHKLKAMGVRLYLDDFGTGYSSLSYLHRFPVDGLKIDRSFVSRLDDAGQRDEIVRTIVTLAQSLGMELVAEGVETVGQLDRLQGIACEYGQGYLFSRPLDSRAMETWLQDTALLVATP